MRWAQRLVVLAVPALGSYVPSSADDLYGYDSLWDNYWYDYANGTSWDSDNNYYNAGGYGAFSSWDTGSCQLHDSQGFAGDCAEFKDDGECDASCNHAECEWDGEDCFHGDECAARAPERSRVHRTRARTARARAPPR